MSLDAECLAVRISKHDMAIGNAIPALNEFVPADREFFDSEKQKTDPPLDSKISKNRNTHLYRLAANSKPITGSIEGIPHPTTTFMARWEGVSTFTSGLPQISATRP